jgi:hypothetical protein
LQPSTNTLQAHKFEQRCFSPIELYSFQDVFKSLADRQDHLAYLKEDTIVRFLKIPDILGVSSIVFQMVSYLGAFPFGKDAPAVLGFEQMIMVIVIMTERYQRVLKKGNRDRTRLLFRSLAVYDRRESLNDGPKTPGGITASFEDPEDSLASRSHVAGFAVDQAANDDDEEDDDDLALAALESLDAIDVFRHGDAPIAQSSIPSDNLKKLIMLLLLAAPLGPQENLALHALRLSGEHLEGLRRTAEHVLAAFVNVEKFPGVKFHQFNTVIPVSLPFLFNGFNPLFEHFLFSQNIGVSKREDSSPLDPLADQHILPQTGEIMDLNVLSQIPVTPCSGASGCSILAAMPGFPWAASRLESSTGMPQASS